MAICGLWVWKAFPSSAFAAAYFCLSYAYIQIAAIAIRKRRNRFREFGRSDFNRLNIGELAFIGMNDLFRLGGCDALNCYHGGSLRPIGDFQVRKAIRTFG